MSEQSGLTRRAFLRSGLALPAALYLAACRLGDPDGAALATSPTVSPLSETTTSASPPATAPTTLAPTPACDEGDDPTPPQTAGPFFTPDSPERTSLLEAGMEGTRLVVSGWVLSTACQPVPGALLDFWQADGTGEYDNVGYRLRGHQYADSAGRFRLETVLPGAYGSRTRHIHVRVQAPGRPILTTQLYFPGEPANERDGIFDPRLVMEVREADGQLEEALFTFVLDLG